MHRWQEHEQSANLKMFPLMEKWQGYIAAPYEVISKH